jgi:hypothetical protein
MTIMSRMLDRSYVTKGYDSCGRNPLQPAGDRLSLLARTASVWQAVLDATVPLGYEDEAGFHYGSPTRRIGPEA